MVYSGKRLSCCIYHRYLNELRTYWPEWQSDVSRYHLSVSPRRNQRVQERCHMRCLTTLSVHCLLKTAYCPLLAMYRDLVTDVLTTLYTSDMLSLLEESTSYEVKIDQTDINYIHIDLFFINRLLAVVSLYCYLYMYGYKCVTVVHFCMLMES